MEESRLEGGRQEDRGTHTEMGSQQVLPLPRAHVVGWMLGLEERALLTGLSPPDPHLEDGFTKQE